jgi:ABC-type uncharacterized transport system involved in gliding motility auxiliary subunit
MSRWLATIVGTLACAVALICAQRLAARTGWRLDLTPERTAVLSEHARGILASLQAPVSVTAFLRADDPRNREIQDLLQRVQAVQPLVQSRILDLNRNPALAREFGVDAYGALAVESDGRRRDFANPDEQTLMAAIIQVTRPDRPRVYLTAGSGERRLGDRDRRSGFTGANIALINERYEVGEIRLDAETPVPDDAATLIVAGPERDLPPVALRQIDAYLHRGGGVLVLLDPGQAPGLVAQLQHYGIVASDEIVLDPERRLFAGDLLTMLVPERSAAHPVSANLSGPPLLSALRPVRAAGGHAIDLLSTSAASWRTPDRSPLTTGGGEFVAGRDTRGPVAVAASTEVPGDGRRPGRLLVVGDADFAANLLLDYGGNRDLLLNAVDWLAGEESMIGSRPPRQLPGENQLFVSAAQGETLFWLGSLAQPAVVLLVGLTVVAVRRRSVTG